jgi:hypothetical protein
LNCGPWEPLGWTATAVMVSRERPAFSMPQVGHESIGRPAAVDAFKMDLGECGNARRRRKEPGGRELLGQAES